MQVTLIEVFIGLLVTYLFYRLSITDPHHWRTFPKLSGEGPNKLTALFIAVFVGLVVIILEGLA